MSDMPNRIDALFAELRAAGGHTLVPFITGGYPDIETTAPLLKDFEARGARICELGIPFSDPIADGPTIQASYTAALGGGVTSAKIFDAVRGYRDAGGEMALLAMVSYSIVFRHKLADYLDAAKAAGFDGLIVPDLPLEEAAGLARACNERNLCNVMLISPTTPQARRIEIAHHSSGFIYFMSVAGITGERTSLPRETFEAVFALRTHTETPMCIGFGISTPEMVAAACEAADGAIVGSAIVKRITAHLDDPLADRVRAVGEFVQTLLAPLR